MEKAEGVEQEQPPIDLSKTVPISTEEEQKLAKFLKKVVNNVNKDDEMEMMVGQTA